MDAYVKNLVDKILKKYGVRNPFEVAKVLNIEVQLGNPGCDGCYIFIKNHRYIFLNQDLGESELMAVMAHELGHALMHKKQNCYFIRNRTLFLNSKIEREANLFAVELLIPDEVILENQHLTTEQFSRLLGYDQALIKIRLESYKNYNRKKRKSNELYEP